MWSVTHPELEHLAETLHPDSQQRTDVGLCPSAELSIIAQSLEMRSVTHEGIAEQTVFCSMVAVTVVFLIRSSVVRHHKSSLQEVDGKQMGGHKVQVWQRGGL